MQARHQVSRAAIDLIKRFEGFREKAAQLPDGRWTLGYGHTLTAREGAWVSEQDAEALLMYDLISVAHAVNQAVYTPLSQNQFDALVAFAFNIGADEFRRSGVVRLINEGQLLKAACAMELWRRADFDGQRIVVDALVRRRAAEKALFLTPPEGFVPAPTPVIRPRVDRQAALVPEAAAVVEVPLQGDIEVASPVQAPTSFEAEPQARSAADTVVARLEKLIAEDVSLEEAFPDTAEPTLPEPESLLPANEGVDLFPQPGPTEPAPEQSAEILEPLGAEEAVVLPPPETEEAADVPPAEPAEAAPAVEPATLKRSNGWKGKVAGLSALALIGAVLLGAGVWWMFNGTAPAAGPIGQGVVGWIVGFAGVVLVAVAAWVLLDLLGRADEELDALED